jgi:Subtilase family
LRTSRLRSAGTASIAFAGLVMATLAVTTTPAGAAGTESVRVAVPLCKAATNGHRTCDSMKLVTRQVSAAKASKLERKGAAKSATSPRIGFGPVGGYSPKQLAKAYGINATAKTSQTVAIVDAFNDPSVRNDLNTFDAQYGFKKETKKSLRVIGQDGGAPPATNDEGWAGEITLDVQSVRAVCRTCKILLVEADDNNDDNLARAVNQAVKQGAKIVSNSYGGPEATDDPQWVQRAYSHHGVAILASSGDDGWYDWDNVNFGTPSTGMSQVPASYKSVVGIGGTSIYLNPNGSRASETVWNENGPADLAGQPDAAELGYEPGAAGSGCSAMFGAPAWQKSVKGYGSLGCGSKRSEVDVAAIADPFTGFDIYESYDWCTTADPNVCPYTAADDGWATYGGTSLASPVIAGMWGLAGGPDHGVANPAKTLYTNYKKHSSSTYDVKVGGTGGCNVESPKACSGLLQFLVYGGSLGTFNPNTGPGGLIDCAWGATGEKVKSKRAQCYAQPGYDGVSGVGTPKGLKVFK